ncbi:MAG: hypothetical protein LBQ61_05405 [Spirochaetales bacterium]|jgi:hypothetical protein|nr:hypothetical protein [Spirochaetales bacterium]
MKIGKKLAIVLMASLIAGMAASCASTGQFMPLEKEETVIGTVQAVFVARNTLNGRDAINTQAYIKLLEAAQQQYASSGSLDIRDIVWVSGRSVEDQNTEYTATGKVVRFN